MSSIAIPSFWRRRIFAFLLAWLALSVSGPFGTYEAFSWPARIGYWGVGLFGCGLFFEFGIILLLRFKPLGRLPQTLVIALGAALSSIPAAFFFAMLDRIARGSFIPLEHMFWMWFSVFAIGLIMSIIAYLPPLVRLDAIIDAREIHARRVPFLQRLPDSLGTQLISLSMQDHYVQVITQRGSELVRVNFAEALDELRSYPGIRVHRSHWVALSAISELARKGRSWIVRLKDGREVPVSRTFLQDVEEHLKARNST